MNAHNVDCTDILEKTGMMMLSLMLIAFFLLVSVAVARPDGSPMCTVGSPAPSSLHLSRSFILTGPLSLGNFTVSIGALELSNSGFNNITSGTNLNLELSSKTGGVFKGVLIILNKPGLDLTSSLTTNSALLKTQTSCPPEGYGGFTHTSRDLKTTAAATINLPANVEAFLDVNVVVVNNSTSGSIYFYSRFQLSTVATPTPVAGPVPAPTAAPVAAPKAALVPAPVPSVAPVPVPTNVTSPVMTPNKAPTRESCGLFGWSIFCLCGCGLFSRIFGLC